MKQRDNRIIIHMGAYGSGKTELSICEALCMARRGLKTALVDLDIVNPFFRSGEHVDMLREQGIRTILPNFANTAVDVPSLPPDVQSVLDDESWYAVFDVGGDPVGAAPLGRYHAGLRGAWVRMIVNTMRPFTQSVEEILVMAEQLMMRSRLQIGTLVHNTHLVDMTTPDMVRRGHEVVAAAAQKLGVPVEFTMARPEIARQIPDLGTIYDMTALFNRLPWQDGGDLF